MMSIQYIDIRLQNVLGMLNIIRIYFLEMVIDTIPRALLAIPVAGAFRVFYAF